MKLNLKFSLISLSLLFVAQSHSYETMVRHGYTSCMTCHHSATGGGLLNGYGKVISQEVSSFGETKEPKMRKLDHGLQVRFARYSHDGEVRHFPMQFDYLAVLSHKEMKYAMTIAKAPKAEKSKSNIKDEIYLRKVLASYKKDNSWSIDVGRDYLDVGFNFIDHTLFIKRQNRRGVTDFYSIVRGNYYQKNSKVSVFGFLPSFQENSSNREKGLGFKLEGFIPKEKFVTTLSALHGKTDTIKRSEVVVNFKKNLGDFSILAQADFTQRKLVGTNTSFLQTAYYIGGSYFPLKSLEIKLLMEKLKVEDPFLNEQSRFGYGLIWKPWRLLSLQVDGKRSTRSHTKFQKIIQLYFNGWFL